MHLSPAAKPKLPADFEETTWSKLQAAVRAVHNKQPVSCSLEELYRVRRGSKPCIPRQAHIVMPARSLYMPACIHRC